MDEIIAQRTGSVRSRGTAFLTCLAAAVAISMLDAVLHFTRFGLDFIDESFYLTSIAHPSAYAFNIPVSLFGFVYHPLFTALDGGIGALLGTGRSTRMSSHCSSIFQPDIAASFDIRDADICGGKHRQRDLFPLSPTIAARKRGVVRSAGRGALILSDDYSAYLVTAVSLARSQGLQPGMPMIDLTGRSPGVLCAMQAHGLGQPWMVGAYPGSDRLAKDSLDTEKCGDIARSWLLDEPEGPRSLTTRVVLAYFGADLDADYVRVGTLTIPPGAGGHPLTYPQYLLKPARLPSTATAACVAARARHSMRPKEKNNE